MLVKDGCSNVLESTPPPGTGPLQQLDSLCSRFFPSFLLNTFSTTQEKQKQQLRSSLTPVLHLCLNISPQVSPGFEDYIYYLLPAFVQQKMKIYAFCSPNLTLVNFRCIVKSKSRVK